MGRESRTRTTIETERISIFACHDSLRGWCERCGREVGMSVSQTPATLQQEFPGGAEQGHLWGARSRVVMGLKALVRLLETTGTRPHS